MPFVVSVKVYFIIVLKISFPHDQLADVSRLNLTSFRYLAAFIFISVINNKGNTNTAS